MAEESVPNCLDSELNVFVICGDERIEFVRELEVAHHRGELGAADNSVVSCSSQPFPDFLRAFPEPFSVVRQKLLDLYYSVQWLLLC